MNLIRLKSVQSLVDNLVADINVSLLASFRRQLA